MVRAKIFSLSDSLRYRLLIFIWVLPGLMFEAGALYFVIEHPLEARDLPIFWLLHGAASLCLAVAVREQLPRQYRRPKWGVLALLAAFSMFIPFAGLLGLLATVLIAQMLPTSLKLQPFSAVSGPQYTDAQREESVDSMRTGGLRRLVLDSNMPAEVRIRSLIALQNLPVRTAAPILRRLLADPADDIRLVAYGILDNQEKRINGLIADELKHLEAARDAQTRQACYRRLAEQYWELVYTGLAQGALRDYVIDQGLRYTERALAVATDDAGLYLLRARLLHARHELEEAKQCYHQGLTYGLPESRVLPYLAEVAFDQHNYALVRDYLRSSAAAGRAPVMAAVMRFWADGGAAAGIAATQNRR